MMFVKLPEKVLGPLDGSSDHLREEHHIRGEGGEITLGALAAAVDLDDVAQALEGVKREPDGEDDRERG